MRLAGGPEEEDHRVSTRVNWTTSLFEVRSSVKTVSLLHQALCGSSKKNVLFDSGGRSSYIMNLSNSLNTFTV